MKPAAAGKNFEEAQDFVVNKVLQEGFRNA